MVAIVVPLYKQALSELETISCRQLFRILGKYEIVIAAPEKLKIPRQMADEGVRVEYFAPEFFESVQSYSNLMLSGEFYERFLRYQYILIYQLDAFVWKDELLYFCSLGYDYIGAPWISGFCEYVNLKRKVLYVGNGGFSLRRVEACINALRCNQALLEMYRDRNEDAFFSACDGANFRVAPKKAALAFAFEREVQTCFAENGGELPFGCHAFERYDLKFWKKYMEDFGYKIGERDVREGMEDLRNDREYRWMKRNTCLMERDDLFYGIPTEIKSLLPISKEGNYFLWGAGYVGRYAGSLLRDLGVAVKGFVDTDPGKQGQNVDGLKVYSPKVLRGKDRVLVTVDWRHCDEIEEKLVEAGFVYLRQYAFFEDILPEIPV